MIPLILLTGWAAASPMTSELCAVVAERLDHYAAQGVDAVELRATYDARCTPGVVATPMLAPPDTAARSEAAPPAAAALARGRVTSRFGWRTNPIRGSGSQHHAGVDIGVPIGSAVYAVAAGVVVEARRHAGHGTRIRVDHGGGVITSYSHLSRASAREGDRVSPGDFIGRSGTSGRSTGPHLHFQVEVDGEPVDPATHDHGSWISELTP